MIVTEGIVQSLEVIRGNKIRSILTMLGINFGVGSLIAIAIIGLAFRNYITSEMGKYGTTLLWVSINDSVHGNDEKRILLDERDLTYFKTSLTGLTGSETLSRKTIQVSYRGNRKISNIMGIDYSHFDIFSIKIEEGRALINQDINLKRNVCVLRPDIAVSLFKSENAVGKNIRIGSGNFTVVGVAEKTKKGFLNDGSDDNTVYIPETYHSKMNGKYWIYIMKFNSKKNMERANIKINNYLVNRYGLIRGKPRFKITVLDSFIKIVNKVLHVVSMLILAIAAVSIVVGGLGIMNIMLVSVTERTREIGVRMAVGASPHDILIQFVIEAITLCLIGGGSGIIFGTGLAAIVCLILKWKFFVSAAIILGALSVSTVIGIIFGIYPAYKASKLMPIEALRSEV